MSRIDHWRISSRHNSNRMKYGTLGTNNELKMLGKPMLRRVNLVRARMQYYKKILKNSEVKNNEN